MAVTRGATTTGASNSVIDDTDASISSHTVDSGTTLLLVSLHIMADAAISGVPQWSLGGGENMTLVHASTAGGAGDVRTYVYGLVSPTGGAGSVSTTITAASDYSYSSAVNYIGTETASVAAATNFLSEDVNDTATNTSVHASAGSSGNALYFAGNIKGGDGSPASNGSSFNELFDTNTGASTSNDGSVYVADLLDSAPSAITVTWAVIDENSSIYIEIVAAAASASKLVVLHRIRGY